MCILATARVFVYVLVTGRDKVLEVLGMDETIKT